MERIFPGAKPVLSPAFVRRFAVHGILPLTAFLLGTLIVFLQFTNSRTVFPEAGLPLYEELRAYHLAHTALGGDAEEQPAGAILLAAADAGTDTLSCLAEVPSGVFPIVETTIPCGGSGLINATELSADLNTRAAAFPACPKEEGPTVLVLHTHATESFYEPENAPIHAIVLGQSEDVFGYYAGSESPRSTDPEKNMVAVGRVFCEELEKMGIGTVHCETLHDLDYSEAYAHAMDSIEAYLEKYPTIRYILDLHRDSLLRDNGAKLKPTAVVDGKKTSQVMLVVGAGSNALPQPGWRDNLAMSARYQSYLSMLEDKDDGKYRPAY